jgi:hypothetical protein
MPLSDDVALAIGTGESYSFADWPNPAVPRFGAGVYTIWHVDGRFICVGMSGRGGSGSRTTRTWPTPTTNWKKRRLGWSAIASAVLPNAPS